MDDNGRHISDESFLLKLKMKLQHPKTFFFNFLFKNLLNLLKKPDTFFIMVSIKAVML